MRDAMSQPRISVVVPFLNHQPYLSACVEALVAQDPIDGPVEIILVDNGSSEDSAAVLDRHPELILLHEPKSGAYAARNTGIRRARAPIVAFTDADCIVERDWLRAICDGMRDPAVAMLIGESRYPAESTIKLKLLSAYENAKAGYVVSRCPPAHHFAYANNMAVRASVFAELGPFLEWERAADTELVHRMAARRPDLQLVFNRSMCVTHMEFLRLRDRLARLSLYMKTNAKIATFKELSVTQRFGVLWYMLRGGSR